MTYNLYYDIDSFYQYPIMKSVKWDKAPWDGLHIGSGIIVDDGRYLLVSNYTGINSISGPFSDIESLDEKIHVAKELLAANGGILSTTLLLRKAV